MIFSFVYHIYHYCLFDETILIDLVETVKLVSVNRHHTTEMENKEQN